MLFVIYINLLSLCPTLKWESTDKSTPAISSCVRPKTATTADSTQPQTAKRSPTISWSATTVTSKYNIDNAGKADERAEPTAEKSQDSQRASLRPSQ
jgi:hypothetical protein